MAIRYSGDVDVRMAWKPRARVYTFSVKLFQKPGQVARGEVPARLIGHAASPTSSEAYDKVALVALQGVLRRKDLPVERRGRHVEVRRTFQAPCPKVV